MSRLAAQTRARRYASSLMLTVMFLMDSHPLKPAGLAAGFFSTTIVRQECLIIGKPHAAVRRWLARRSNSCRIAAVAWARRMNSRGLGLSRAGKKALSIKWYFGRRRTTVSFNGKCTIGLDVPLMVIQFGEVGAKEGDPQHDETPQWFVEYA